MIVPFMDLQKTHASLREEIVGAWGEIVDSARFIGGPHVTGFEEEFARVCGSKHCVSVSSGTDALRFILLALGLNPGDEVITAPNTFIATTEAISQAGGRVVFADIDPRTYTIDPSSVRAAITPRTRGILPVHLYGQCADMTPLRKIASDHGLWIVEDACQAHLAEYDGRRAGSLARAAAFSFYPGKNLGACGEAGAVTTDDGELADSVRMLRDHGQKRKYHHEREGFNGRCDALQAAALRIKLKHLEGWTRARREKAALYLDMLKDIPGLVLPAADGKCRHVFHLFVVQVEERERVAQSLAEKGVQTGLHYPVPLHLQEAYSWMGLPRGSFPHAERFSSKLLSLPLYPELSEEQTGYVCDQLRLIL